MCRLFRKTKYIVEFKDRINKLENQVDNLINHILREYDDVDKDGEIQTENSADCE